MTKMTRRMKKKTVEMETQELTRSTINDVPPEVLEMILKKLDSGGNSMLPYRLVHPQWENIISGLLEKRAQKGDIVPCSQLSIVYDKAWPSNLHALIRCPQTIHNHPGNPFPSRSLRVTRNFSDRRNYGTHPIVEPLHIFTTKFGIHLNTFVLGHVHLEFETLIKILRPMSNLRILKFSATSLKLDSKDDLLHFPALPHLTTFGLKSVNFSAFKNRGDANAEEQFLNKLIDAYANHLVSLELEQKRNYFPLEQRHAVDKSNPFPSLQHLKVFNPSTYFLGWSCVLPLKCLFIVGVYLPNLLCVNVDVLMRFVDKFRNTLECLDFDIKWSEIFTASCKKEVTRTGGLLQTAAVTFPKLTKLSIPYPTNEMETVVLKKSFLVKFPALCELHFIHFKLSCDVYSTDRRFRSFRCVHQDRKQRYRDTIKEFLLRENYLGDFTTLQSISVWFTEVKSGSTSCEYDNLVYFQDKTSTQLTP